MAVTIDAIGTMQPQTSNSLTSFNYNGITVGSGPNSALLFLVYHTTTANPTGISCHWDSAGANQVMAAFGPQAGVGARVRMYALVNPTPGNKTLSVTWTTSDGFGGCAISFNGVLQTSSTAAFINYQSSAVPSSSSTASLGPIVSSTPSDMQIAGTVCNVAITSGGVGTVAWNTNCFQSGGELAELEYALAGGSGLTFNWSYASASSGGSSGINVVWDGVTGAAAPSQNAGIIGMSAAEW